MEPKHHDCATIGCDELTWGVEPKVCTVCIEKRTSTLTDIWQRAYFAYAAAGESIENCKEFADLSVSAWSAMTAERDALIAKAVES